MSIHIQTGNKVDVLQEIVEGELIVVGIQPWGKETIPLVDPKDLAEVILNNLGSKQK